MRSDRPMPGNPWPHDMVITIDDDPYNLDLLLFIRSSWGVAQDVDLPELDPRPDPGTSSPPATASLDEWGARWKREWTRAWNWYSIQDPTVQPTSELLRALSRPRQPLHPAFPPFWQSEYGDDGIDQTAFNKWIEHLRPDLSRQIGEPPERMCLPALIAAWETGLEAVVTLPYSGYFAQRISRKRLVVSAATRADPESYNRALGSATIPNWKA